MTIDLNTIFILLVLCNQELDTAQKITNILSFISFDCDPSSSSFGSSSAYGTITFDEFEYMFRLFYLLLSRVSSVDLVRSPQVRLVLPVPNTKPQKKRTIIFGSELEADLAKALFGIGGGQESTEVDIDDVKDKMVARPDVKQLLCLFSQGKYQDGMMESIAGEPVNKSTSGQAKDAEEGNSTVVGEVNKSTDDNATVGKENANDNQKAQADKGTPPGRRSLTLKSSTHHGKEGHQDTFEQIVEPRDDANAPKTVDQSLNQLAIPNNQSI